jgi:Concanavalin A-like lectin/glucanases superfamily
MTRAPRALSNDLKLICCWDFDSNLAGPSYETISNSIDIGHGVQLLVPGLTRKALRFDGFTTFLERAKTKKIAFGNELTVEAWVCLGNFPWNLAPIVEAAEDHKRGFALSIDEAGNCVFGACVGLKWIELRSQSLGLETWHHVAGTVTASGDVSLYLDGQKIDHAKGEGAFVGAPNLGAYLGRSREKLVGTGGIRPYAHMPSYMYLDGVLDEIKIYSGAKNEAQIGDEFANCGQPPKAPLPERRLPSGPAGKGKFGAYYTQLKYYDAWDRRWRVGEHPDVVVRFDEEAYRFVFWRGTNYIPCWVTDNGIWYTNEFNETWGNGAVGCAEPMSDKQCIYSHVRIIETNDARCVVHWRYALVDVFGTRPRQDPVTKWTDWTDEVYTIYPDGTGTRKITLHSTHPLEAHEWQESIVVLQPGQRPEDVLDPEALTMANMGGEEHVYSWVGGCPEVINKPDRANILRVNIKSDTKPFVVVSNKHCLKRNLEPSDRPVFPVYREEIRPPQLFPWWNHWPTSDMPSDGRHAVSSDRASHSSLITGMEWEDYEVTLTSRTRVMMHGLTRHSTGDLAGVAKSWLQAPGLRVLTDGFRFDEYSSPERAYILTRLEPTATALELVIDANHEHPLVNLAMRIKNWSGGLSIKLDGKPVLQGPNFRLGELSHLEGQDLIFWLKISATQPVTLSISQTLSNSDTSAVISHEKAVP